MKKFLIVLFFIGLSISTFYTTISLAQTSRGKYSAVRACGLFWGNVAVDNRRSPDGFAAINGYVTFVCANGNTISCSDKIYFSFSVHNLNGDPNDSYHESGNSGYIICGQSKRVTITFSPLNVGDYYYYEWIGTNSGGNVLWYLYGYMQPI